MHLINKIATKASRILGVSIAALMLSTMAMSSVSAADIPTVYNNSCAACHDSGALNALKKGDSRWQQLKQKKGMPALINSVKGGMIQMPAGGLCNNCSDEEYRQLIEYMSK